MNELIVDEDLIEQFEVAWADAEPTIDEFVPEKDSDSRQGTLRELVIIDLEFRWKQSVATDAYAGDVPSVEDYVERFPELGASLLRDQLAGEEFTIRRKYGDQPSRESFVNRFPHLAARIGELDVEYPAGTRRRAHAGTNRVASVVDHYTLIREIGEGGMGTVYLARQEEPIRRLVAIKVIRAGLDSKEVIARFEAERQALAMMDHPNIARVFEAGTTDQGQPYFAMEYAAGVPLTDYCSQNQLGVPQRLAIFNDVCAAVQHAHQKGILHRDLKPSNVLITQEDGRPVAKVIDFGLAKAIDNSELLTDKDVYTHAGQVLGTLKYMSPEQASIHEQGVDTRADVYALGVMLYELLTGETPLDEVVIREQGVLTVLEMIRDHEPPRPSARLAVDQQTSAAISAERATSLTALRQLLRGDLDWVVMKAIEKDRNRRYDSVSSLADDVKRFLNDDPVLARPPSASYLLQKFTRKNRVLVLSGAAMLILLLIGIATTSYQAIRATGAEETAARQERIAVARAREADDRREEAEVARGEAEAATRRAENILAFVVQSYKAADPTKGARKELKARDVLVQALGQVAEHVGEDPLSQATLYDALASSLYGLGDYESAGPAAVLAIERYSESLGIDHDKSIGAINLLGNTLVAGGHWLKAWGVFSDSLLVQQGTIPGFGSWRFGLPWQERDHAAAGSFSATSGLGAPSHRRNQVALDDLLPASPLAAETVVRLASCIHRCNISRDDNGESISRKAFKFARLHFGDENPLAVAAASTLAEVLISQGNQEEALRIYDRFLKSHAGEIGDPAVAEGLQSISRVLHVSQRFEEAIELSSTLAAYLGETLGLNHPRTRVARCGLAECVAHSGDLKAAETILASLRDGATAPSDAYRRAARDLATIYLKSHDIEAALALFVTSPPDRVWCYIVANQPAEAAVACDEWFAQAKSIDQKVAILKRMIALQQWAGDWGAAGKAIALQSSLLRQGDFPFDDVLLRIARLRQMVGLDKFENAKAEGWELLNPNQVPVEGLAGLPFDWQLPATMPSLVLREIDKAWTNSLLASCRSKQPHAADFRSSAMKAFDEIYLRMELMPDYFRWTAIRSCERVIQICDAEGDSEEADRWRERLSELEAERVRLTLEDDWAIRLYDVKAGGKKGETQY